MRFIFDDSKLDLSFVKERIIEIKNELQNLECSQCHFVGNGVAREILTPDNTQLNDLPFVFIRCDEIETLIKETYKKIQGKKAIDDLTKPKGKILPIKIFKKLSTLTQNPN